MSTLAAMQYRVDFLVRGLIALLWSALTLVPLLVVFGVRQQVAGWTFGEALVVVGWFTLLRAVLEGAVSPSLTAVVEHVRKGTLDFVLLKPADAQFLVSTAKFEPWRVVDVVGAVVVFCYAFATLGRWPSPAQVATGAGVPRAGGADPLLDLDPGRQRRVLGGQGRQPVLPVRLAVRRRPLADRRVPRRVARHPALAFTFVFPLALMTTYPALALLGRLDARTAVLALGGGIAFAVVARRVWRRALAMYTSASS